MRKSYQVLNKTDVAVLVIDGSVGASPEDAAVLEQLPDDADDRDVFADASMPGIRQQMPRTIILICTPACDAS